MENGYGLEDVSDATQGPIGPLADCHSGAIAAGPISSNFLARSQPNWASTLCKEDRSLLGPLAIIARAKPLSRVSPPEVTQA